MVQESFEKAEDDFKERQAREARIEADRVLAAVEKAKKSDAFWELPEDERAAIDRAVNELLVVYCCADHFLIRIKMEQVDHVTHHLAEIMVNSAVSGALKGTKI